MYFAALWSVAMKRHVKRLAIDRILLELELVNNVKRIGIALVENVRRKSAVRRKEMFAVLMMNASRIVQLTSLGKLSV